MVKSYSAITLKDALKALSEEKYIPYSGGTDLMVKADESANYLFINKIPELKNINADENYIRIGSGCTFTEIIEHKLTPAILKEAASQVAAPAIRNLGTVGGNICNGSPKADSAIVFFVTDSKLRLVSSEGERIIPIREFYKGRNKTVIQDNELLVEILINKKEVDNYYYKKVGARNALAISRVSFAAVMDITDERIVNCSTAFGAVSDVVISVPEIDTMLLGKTIMEARDIKEEYLRAYEKEINPIKGRISAEYRKSVCMNLLRDFLQSNGI